MALRVDQETLPIRVQEVVQDTPAAKAGLKPGSWIVSDNGTNTVGKTVNECAGMIRGAVGAEVKLEIVEPDFRATNQFTLKLEKL